MPGLKNTEYSQEELMKFKREAVKNDKKISIALMATFVVLTLQYLILIYFKMMGTEGASAVQQISKILVGLVFLYALPAVLNRSLLKGIIVFSAAVIIFLCSYIFFPVNQPYIKNLIFPFFFMCLPAFVYSISIRDWKVLKDIMKKASYFVFVAGVVIAAGVFSGLASVGTYSMPFSYYMLLPAIMFMDELLDRFRLRTLLFTLISVLVILALGARGPVLCLLVFFVFKLIKPRGRFNYQGMFLTSGAATAGLVGYIFRDGVLKALNNIFLHFGIESRSIALFLIKGVHLSGRDRISQLLVSKIGGSPFWGFGLAGDRPFLWGSYAHNFFLEIVVNFGIIIGFFVLLIIFYLILKSLVTKNKDGYSMLIIWMGLGFVHLMVSGSYLIDLKFWVFMGLVLSSLNLKIERDQGSRV
ncbi:MAG: hypothetical protein GYA86_04320 [Firmicutes bacterium]|nr:hypothetical protein [Bacillota bacterium]